MHQYLHSFSEKGFVIEDVKVEHKPIIENEGKVKKITLFETIQLKEELSIGIKYNKENLHKIEAELKELTDKISKLKRSKDVLRAIKWWRKGNLEEDKVDSFLDYFISFEMLASIKGYKRKYGDNWAKEFSNNYSITYKPDGETTISDIRNKIMHEPGPKKEKAEKLANQYANSFGEEVLKTIKNIVERTL
ncbi:MAG: hypothetical protein ACP5LN_03430 [Thermoproteota archaeon]